MLELTRKVRDKVIINEDVTIEIKSVRGQKVELVIKAPKNMKVLRKELVRHSMKT